MNELALKTQTIQACLPRHARTSDGGIQSAMATLI